MGLAVVSEAADAHEEDSAAVRLFGRKRWVSLIFLSRIGKSGFCFLNWGAIGCGKSLGSASRGGGTQHSPYNRVAAAGALRCTGTLGREFAGSSRLLEMEEDGVEVDIGRVADCEVEKGLRE